MLQIASTLPKAKAKAKTRVHLVYLSGPNLGLFVRDGEVKYFVSEGEGKGQKYWRTKILLQWRTRRT